MSKFTFYHGTDARIINMDKEERQQYLNGCNLVIDTIFSECKPLLKMEKVDLIRYGQKVWSVDYALHKFENKLNERKKGLYTSFLEKLVMINARNSGCELYQYNNLYLTSSKLKAMQYAERSFAGGEIGLIALRFIEGYEVISNNKVIFENHVQKAIERILDFSKDGKELPVIITIDDIDVSYIVNENGTPLYDFQESENLNMYGDSFRYKKYIDLSSYNSEVISKELRESLLKDYH